ncbi:MAG TPA: TIGR00730 family Rossman fold protein [Bacteroidales bacterium]|nr:TIGR00730 family Rossman fold protein [Bacteroidales bacterium]HOL98248.1 TIGR00730 family Rossman fold protein [Bacteroidales bacterium]HOM36601.1 TIGR00730 family Rossman fold protein [Bacteroidales bacterium]HPD24027.1 TIGR00730 family Rossman fold protein [Bacteroidales bacterium]HRT00022.1 TIGR00730 family Rossman fold protein [Bacteroidales bacterium]
MKKTICVFCSSSEDLRSDYYEMATKFGEKLASENYNLIHGGGSIGIMGRLMKAVFENGGQITGVVPEKLNKPNIVDDKYQRLIITTDMKERKEFMRQNSDAFVALPGGFGTLEELSEIITLKQLKYHDKPIVIFNYTNFFNKLIDFFEFFFNEHFAIPDYKQLYYVTNQIDDVFRYLKNYNPTNIYDKYLKQ